MNSFITAAIAILVSTAVAAPAGILGLPTPSKDLPSVPSLGLPTSSIAAVPSATPSASSGGQLVTNLGPQVNGLLTVVGQDAKPLLVQLSPEIAALLSGLGLPSVGAPVGSVVATAGNVGDLLQDIAPKAQGLLTVVGQDSSVLLVQLSPSVATLVAGLGLPALSVPVGSVVATLGQHVKRQSTGELLNDIGKEVNGVLTVTGPDAKKLLIQLSPEVTALLTGLGLPALGVPVGSVVASASSVGDLISGLGPDTEGLLVAVGTGAQYLLIQLAPAVAGLVSSLGLPTVGVPVGTVVVTLATNL